MGNGTGPLLKEKQHAWDTSKAALESVKNQLTISFIHPEKAVAGMT